jgi:hypothetical protein
MAKVYGFNVSGGSPLFASEADWEKQITVEGAKHYLNDHLLAQLTRDVPPAIDAFIDVHRKKGVEVGFYAVGRMVFPTLSFLGCLYKGDDSTAHAIEFLEEYAGRKFEPKYLDLGAAVVGWLVSNPDFRAEVADLRASWEEVVRERGALGPRFAADGRDVQQDVQRLGDLVDIGRGLTQSRRWRGTNSARMRCATWRRSSWSPRSWYQGKNRCTPSTAGVARLGLSRTRSLGTGNSHVSIRLSPHRR